MDVTEDGYNLNDQSISQAAKNSPTEREIYSFNLKQ